MEGFKSNPKMKSGVACYKEGGAVYKSRHSEKTEEAKDIAQDKQVVKKAFKMHDTQSHEGEKTDLSNLKKGGRIKKCGGGNVRKYKAGGSVTGGSDVAKDGGKKTGGANIKTGQKTGSSDVKKDGGKRTGGSDVAKDGGAKSMGLNNVFKKGGAVKKYASGGMANQGSISEAERAAAKKALSRPRGMQTEEELERMPKGPLPQQMTDELATEENTRMRSGIMNRLKQLMPGQKKGGKVKKYADGGPVSQTAQEIIEGKRPAQSTPGKMTPEERRASIGKAFGAK